MKLQREWNCFTPSYVTWSCQQQLCKEVKRSHYPGSFKLFRSKQTFQTNLSGQGRHVDCHMKTLSLGNLSQIGKSRTLVHCHSVKKPGNHIAIRSILPQPKCQSLKLQPRGLRCHINALNNYLHHLHNSKHDTIQFIWQDKLNSPRATLHPSLGGW